MKVVDWSCVLQFVLRLKGSSIIPRKSDFLNSGPAVSSEMPPLKLEFQVGKAKEPNYPKFGFQYCSHL